MKAKDWAVLIIMLVGLFLSGASLALTTFEGKDANRGQHQIILEWLARIDAKLDRAIKR